MADYIDKDAALEVLNELARSNFTLKPGYEYYLGALHDVGQDIKYLPSADVKPVVRGRWNWWEEEYHEGWCCSECGICVPKDDIKNFCPNCGADMRGNDND